MSSVEQVDYSMSQLSLNSSDTEDWDRSMSSDADPNHPKTPRNSVSFPGHGADEGTPSRNGSLSRGAGKRTLSELLKLHAEEGTDVNFTPEEASRVAEVLGQWINSSSSPYEGEDDFFSRQHSQDDSSIPNRPSSAADAGRPRGQSESVVKS
ncbi:hypothetical protein L226DRAFT_530868 [Lentinus tigrinus ALCF2SS1-7]|uniref:Uncharacterized protein n=1 Tax=Lentinus tigrinus ALCF2SS1-6 TaxID=1328759 RepID=A0A5C2SPL5_9APHY|nr:hypothetical protein L227DRAFT_570882 [Lentinus tigrinus ALCF2SS1-6]RPD79004.1 hypothetical protein L226DRAFT_530868 [Lentinus tigrinus ALCF2SS1-7]